MQKEFFRHAGRLFSWTVAGQAIGLLSAPIVARLYGPEAYGVASMVISTGGTIAIASSLRYEQAIVVADTEQDAIALERLSRRLVASIGLISAAICTILYMHPPESFGDFFQGSLYLLFGIPIIAVINGNAFIRRRVANRHSQFSSLGQAMFLNSVVVPFSRIASGLIVQGNSLLLVLSGVLGWAAEVLRLGAPNLLKKRESITRSQIPLRAIAFKYKDFPKYSLPEGLLSNVSTQLPIYTLGFIYSPAVVGLFALAVRFVRMPVLALSNSVSQVLLRQFEERHREGGSLSAPVVKSTLALLLISIAIGIPTMAYSEPIFRVILGESWAQTGLYAATLIPWIASAVVVIPAGLSFVVLRRQELRLVAQVALFLLRIAILSAAAISNFDVLTTLWIFSLVSAAINALTIAVSLYILMHHAA